MASSTSPARQLGAAMIAFVVTVSALLLTPNYADPDLWGHIQFGRDLLRFGLPATTTYSYTADGFPWINHEILSEILFAYCVDHWGSGSLVLLKSLAGMCIVASMIWFARRQAAGSFVTSASVVLVTWSMSYYWSVRPQVVSFLLFAIMIAILTWTFEPRPRTSNGPSLSTEGKVHVLTWIGLVPLMFVWTNAHGEFLAGLAIATAYLGMRSLELVLVAGTSAWRTCG